MHDGNDYATLVVQHHVRTDARELYEAWVKQIADEGKRFPGHLGVNVIRPHGSASTYTIILRFDSHENLTRWLESDVRKQLVARARPWFATEEQLELETGLEYWFTPPAGRPAHAKPSKQFLVTLSAIFPLTVLVPWVLRPVLVRTPLVHWPLAMQFVVVAVIVLLMVYAVMPRYTRLVANWLFR